jgi:acetyltransferase-like isoleucine patch superfamily enzyme
VIKQGVYIGPQCNIGACVIEKDCLLGSGVHILSGKQQHNFDDLDKPIREQGGHFSPITLGEDTWVGNGAIIMANVGKKCIVAAGAVVTKDIPDFAIVAGNPAAIIKMRK